MEQLLLTYILLSSTLGLFGFLLSCFIFLKFDKVKGFFNKRAGTEIVTFFSFRTVRTVLIALIVGGILSGVDYILPYTPLGKNMSDQAEEWLSVFFVVLTLGYPAWRIVQCILQYTRSDDKKTDMWLIAYKALMNVAMLFGGYLAIIVLAFVAVILSFTRWCTFIPNGLRELSGVNVVPESKMYYIAGAALGVIAVVSQWIADGDLFVAWLVGISVTAFILYAIFRIRSTPKEGRKQLSWQWGYMILTTYAVFTITWILIFIALILLIIYIIFMFIGDSSSSKDPYKVTCDNLTSDVINGRGICSITNSRCKARDTGSCPYK